MKLPWPDFFSLTECREYAPYLLVKPGQGDTVFLDWNKLPKTHYLPISGDSVAGYVLCGKINAAIHEVDSKGLLKIGVQYDARE